MFQNFVFVLVLRNYLKFFFIGHTTQRKESCKTEKRKKQIVTELDARDLEMYGSRIGMFFRGKESDPNFH